MIHRLHDLWLRFQLRLAERRVDGPFSQAASFKVDRLLFLTEGGQ